MAPHEEHEGLYHPKDAISITTETTLIVGGFGALLAAIRNTLARQNVGAMGVVTRFGGTTGVFGA